MSTLNKDDMTTFAHRFNDIFDGPNIQIADDIFAEDFIGHLPLAPVLDRQGWKAYVGSFYAGMSDLRQHVHEVIVGDERLVLRVSYTGTHDGTMLGVPASGKPVNFEGIGIFRFDANGRVAENWAVVDVAGVLAQIGALPTP